jgi:NAD/NADP transhydrogenase alpha subunit
MNRDRRPASAVAFGLLGLVALLAAGAAVVLGIIVMTRK